MSKATQRGFTLIELVVVIVILGILSAFAVPRFIGLEGKAREAAIQGLAGSVRGGAALAHAAWLAQGDATLTSIKMDNVPITIAIQYPDLATIKDTVQDTTGFTYTAATGVWTKDGAPTPANCSVKYTAATATAPASVTSDITKCQ